jgi:predicted RNase H-like nuclease (RuvC/YqgF family)
MKNSFLWIYFKQKFKALREALKLQAKEYERRLEGLNHEADQLKNMQSTYTSKEVFDRTMDAMNQRFERVVNELKEKIEILNLWKTKQEGKSQLIQYIPWLLTAISIIILYTKK